MTTPSASPADRGTSPAARPSGALSFAAGRGVAYWYQATRLARASASCRYRMGNLAELTRGMTTLVDRRPSRRALRGIRTLVIVRPFLDRASQGIIDRCRGDGVRLIADFDDLLFAGDPAEYPLVQRGAVSAEQWGARIAHYRAGLSQFDGFSVATQPLVEQLTAIVPAAKVAWVENGVSPFWVRQGRASYCAWQPGDPKVMRFLPGSPSHDADFATIVPVLRRFLGAHPEVSLQVVGPLDLAAHGLGGSQVSQAAAVPFAELPRYLASSWLTVAPLVDTAFNRCKSAIKFLEAAAFACPCIASPSADMMRHVDGGALVAEGEAQWREHLEQLLDDPYRVGLGRRCQEYVDRHGTARHGVAALAQWMESWPKG